MPFAKTRQVANRVCPEAISFTLFDTFLSLTSFRKTNPNAAIASPPRRAARRPAGFTLSYTISSLTGFRKNGPNCGTSLSRQSRPPRGERPRRPAALHFLTHFSVSRVPAKRTQSWNQPVAAIRVRPEASGTVVEPASRGNRACPAASGAAGSGYN